LSGAVVGGAVLTRVRRWFSVRSETKQNGSEILFALKRNREVCFACFPLNRNSRIHMPNEKKVKLNRVNKAKRNETKEAQRNKREKNLKAK
jgi:hypothetical protein